MTLRKINASFISITKAFSRSQGKVLNKFLVDMIFGIISSKSLNLSWIARSLERESSTTSRYIHKRICRLLGDYDLSKVKESVQAKQAREIEKDTYIYFDPTDVIKPHGKKFELMCRVADGSNDHEIEKGYPAIACVAMKDAEIIPLDLDIFSYSETTFDSQNQKFLDHIDGISERTRGNGIQVFDKGFDGFAYIRRLHQRCTKFIIRMGDKRKYYLVNDHRKSFSRHEIINKHATIKTSGMFDIRYQKKLEKIKFNIKAVEVDLLNKIDSDKPLTLIRGKSKNLTLYLLTNVEEISQEAVINIFQAYLDRWKVEEYIRFVKQQYKMEKFQVMSLAKIRNLIQLLFISTVILTRLAELGVSFSKTRATLINKAKRTYKIPQKLKFFLYLIADGLAYVLKNYTKKIEAMADKIPKTQLALPLAGKGRKFMG